MKQTSSGPRWLAVILGSCCLTALAAEFPPADQLPSRPELPDPLQFFDGRPVTNTRQWFEERRPEIKALFEFYEYGKAPPPPTNLTAKLEHEDTNLFNGLGIKRQITLTFGPPGTPPLNLLLLIPKQAPGRVPVFVAPNFCGNHTVLDDPRIPLPQTWVYSFCPGCKENKATEEGRGGQLNVWCPEYVLKRGYALATFYNGDIDPDQPDFQDGVHPHFLREGQTELGPHDWGSIAAWAWGVQRVVDYVLTVPEIDTGKICAIGHSRLGKTVLLAAAFDERIALVVPHQSGTGGCALSRGNDQETVERINRVFPHWFCDAFVQFDGQEDRLPVDQHLLEALVAPRPLLDTEGVQDTWANYNSGYRGLKAADKVYKFLGNPGMVGSGLIEGDTPLTKENTGTLLQYRRDDKHVLNQAYWEVILNFADLKFAR